jgi:hypothetical protein
MMEAPLALAELPQFLETRLLVVAVARYLDVLKLFRIGECGNDGEDPAAAPSSPDVTPGRTPARDPLASIRALLAEGSVLRTRSMTLEDRDWTGGRRPGDDEGGSRRSHRRWPFASNPYPTDEDTERH